MHSCLTGWQQQAFNRYSVSPAPPSPPSRKVPDAGKVLRGHMPGYRGLQLQADPGGQLETCTEQPCNSVYVSLYHNSFVQNSI